MIGLFGAYIQSFENVNIVELRHQVIQSDASIAKVIKIHKDILIKTPNYLRFLKS